MGRPVGQITQLLSRHVYFKKRRAKKQLFAETQKGKRQPTKESTTDKKTLTLSSGIVVAEGEDEVDVDVGE
jgi:hypothetical protein